ncbi:MAG: hypothetical protein J5486_07970 [Bacteroidaceae bacterium]|nr:hypothetical protein [Bacteroidaceae bacterium]
MAHTITIREIAGYATERTVWQLALFLAESFEQGLVAGIDDSSVVINNDTFELQPQAKAKASSSSNKGAFSAPELFAETQGQYDLEKAATWSLGAVVFTTLMGMDVFEGMGGQSQNASTQIPRISSAHATQALSTLVFKCLSFNPSDRPTMHDIIIAAKQQLETSITPPKRLTTASGKTYTTSLMSFWPEEMYAVLFAIILTISSLGEIKAQTATGIPSKLTDLVSLCIDLRNKTNSSRVTQQLDDDLSWTLMDELEVDRKGECTINDDVQTLGINDIGDRILKYRGGVTNTGGRFRNGQDKRYNYSFIEVTARKGASVKYEITGREGAQYFAVVPFSSQTAYTPSLTLNGKPLGTLSKAANGVSYIKVDRAVQLKDKMYLKIENKSGANASFVILNYNSRQDQLP